MARDIIISSGEINSYGYRIDVAGIDLTNYLKNPVLLWNHDSNKPSIGKVENLRIENGKLVGTPVFDLKDELAAEIASKYEDGFINTCSIWHSPRKLSSDAEDIVPGQTRATVTETMLNEISFVNIPGDAGAHRLTLSEGQTIEDVVPKLSLKKQKDDMNKIAEALGLKSDASEEQILQRINALKLNLSNSEQSKIEALIEKGRLNGSISDDNEDAYRGLAKADFKNAEKLISLAKGKVAESKSDDNMSIQEMLTQISKGGNSGQSEETDAEKFDRLQKTDSAELRRLKNEKPEEYSKLALAYSSNPKK